MAITFPRTNSIVRLRKSTNVTTVTNGAENDVREDFVANRTRTLKVNDWRPPTRYDRYVRNGYTTGFDANGVVDTPSNRWTRTGFTTCGGFYFGDVPSMPQYLVDRTVAKCLNKLKNDHVSLGQAFAERRQTADLLHSNVEGIIRSIDQADGGPLRELAKKLPYLRTAAKLKMALKAMASQRLQVAYGWTPLLADSKGIIEHLMEREKEANRAIITVKSGAKETYTGSSTVSFSDAGATMLVDKHYRVRHKAFTRLDYRLANPGLHEWSQLGLTNPAQIAWEVVPFSFVADWFLPIGDYLNQLDAALGMQFLGGSTTKVSRLECKPTNVRPQSMSGITSANFVVSGDGYMMRFSRSTHTSSPSPVLPGFKPGKSASHAFNGAALITAAFTKAKYWR